jgi:hypothetical protein
MSAVQTYILNQVYTMNPGDKRPGDKLPEDKHKIENSSKRKRGEHKTPDELRLEELQEEIEKTKKKIKHFQTMDEYKKTMVKDNNDEMAIAERAKKMGINMSAPLPSGKNYEDFEEEIRKSAAAEEVEAEREHFKHLGQELQKELDRKKNNGGKNKRKSHKNKSNKRKSHKRKSYKRSKH